MNDSILCAEINRLRTELDRLRTELAASKAVAVGLEEQRAKAEERVRELEQQLADTCSCRFVPDTCDEQVSNGELQRCDYHRDLWTVLSEARQQLAAAQASCTVMRKALELCYWSIMGALPTFPRRIDTSGHVQDPLGMNQAYEVAHCALATDAGKETLDTLDAKDERIKELEEALSAIVICYVAITEQERVQGLVDWEIRNALVQRARKALGLKEAPDANTQ